MKVMKKAISKNVGLSLGEKVQLTIAVGFIVGVICAIVYNSIKYGTEMYI